MNDGWIKLHRCLLDKAIWQQSSPEQKVILTTLLLMANHEEKEWEWQGKQFKAEPGQFVTSANSIMKRAGKDISRQNVRSALEKFKKYEFLAYETTKTGMLITIVNWGLYQDKNFQGNQATNQEVTNGSPRGNQEVTTNKNDNNYKNDRNIYINDFEDVWKLYPNKKGKAAARNSYTKLRKKFTKEELLRTVERYSLVVKDSDIQFIKHGSTFFNSGYEDYLDSNYSEAGSKTSTRSISNCNAWLK